MSPRRMIFHIPMPLPEVPYSGSTVRPLKLCKAFEKIGYQVEKITGFKEERERIIEKIKKNIAAGIKYDFIYSESLTLPLLLSEPSHIPFYPPLDYIFFRWARSRGIPVGLYYRDIYWKFDIYKKNMPFYKIGFSYPFFYYDLHKYYTTVDILFLQNLKMQKFLPYKFNFKKIIEVPPGTELISLPEVEIKGKINLLYVGGITPPVYDLSPLFEALKKLQDLPLTVIICSRKRETDRIHEFYDFPPLPNLEIVNATGEKLVQLYRKSHISLLYLKPHPYREFVLPIKLFEALTYNKPIIGIKNSAAGDFIQKNGIGWVLSPEPEEFVKWIKYILSNPSSIREKTRKVEEVKIEHTWEKRALLIANSLKSISIR